MSQPLQQQPSPQPSTRYANALSTTALLGLILCPALALLPPRKLDFYTVGLVTATGYSANFLLRERTGRGFYEHLRPQRRREGDGVIPREEQANLQRELGHASAELERLGKRGVSVTEEVRGQREAWKVQREKEIKEDLEEGKGLGDMIYDQVWEVWNWGKGKGEEEE